MNMKPNKNPNIIIITSDQHRGDCYGFKGKNIKTPHLDKMAQGGVVFDQCITPNAVCQPARSSILTGLLPCTHGVSDNGIDLQPEMAARGFGKRFSEAGYSSGFIGKAHFSTHHTFQPTGSPECRWSIPKLNPDWQGPYMGFHHLETMVLGHYANTSPKPPPDALHYERWFFQDGKGNEKIKQWQTRLKPDIEAPQTWNSALPVAWHTSTWVADRSIEFIKYHQEGPFILWISFPDPHTPFDCPEPWSRLHHPETVDLPRQMNLDFENKPWWHKKSFEGTPNLQDQELQQHRAKWSRQTAPDEEPLRHLIANYYGMISLIDHNLGRINTVIDDLGLNKTTLRVFTSDHGEWLGDHGLLLKGPMLYEGLLRVGLILQAPWIEGGSSIYETVSTLDIAPTIYDYAKLNPHQNLHGQSLRPLIENNGTRDYALSEWDLRPSRNGLSLRLKTVRTSHAKLTYEFLSGTGEMYDLTNDPDEMYNLYDDPGYRPLRKELMEMIQSRPDDEIPMLDQVGMA